MKKISPKIGQLFLVLLLFFVVSGSARKEAPAIFEIDGVQMENIDRGLTALVRADTSIYLGWRLLIDDPEDIAFNIYRKMIGSVEPNDYIKLKNLI